MELIKHNGKKKNSEFFEYNGWDYYSSNYKKGVHFYCTQKSTKYLCTVELLKNEDGSFTVNENDHNHPKRKRDHSKDLERELKKKALECVRTSSTVRDVLKNYKKPMLTESAARKVVEREIKIFQSEIPSTLLQLSEILSTNPLYEDIYIGSQKTEDDVAIFLGSKTMLKKLNDASDITIETTSRCLPPVPQVSNLLTIHIKKFKKGVPALYIICSSRTQKLNNVIFKFLIKECENLKDNLTNVICDYDINIIIPIRENFPNVIINDCFINFIKLLSRKWLTLNLPADYNNEVCMLSWLLKIIPESKIDEVLDLIQQKSNDEADDNENLLLYSRFVQKCKPFLIKKLFIDDHVDDATSPAELFNIHLLKNFGCHNDIHKFLKLVKINIKQSDKQWNDEKFLKNKSGFIKIGYDLSLHQKRLIKNKITVQQFLKEFLNSKLIEEIKLQLSWPHYSGDKGKLIGVPNLKSYLKALPPQDNEEVFENPCVYCRGAEASIQVKVCGHFIGCYLCWINDYHVYDNRTCPTCRAQYQQVNMF